MNTPICDFVREYADKGVVRMHMPGHKGATNSPLNIEKFDITEITDADDLYHPEGIICESEKNCSLLFECDTYYSTEGSSLGIRAMIYLCLIRAVKENFNSKIIAARNCHRTFLTACALLDVDVDWVIGDNNCSYLNSSVTSEDVRKALLNAHRNDSKLPMAVYLTSPDYTGKTLNIRDIADVCHEYNVPLIVDNAHGAYLKFDGSGKYPIDLGADMCVDSAHKTLPVLTGGAYIHVGDGLMKDYSSMVKDSMVMFGSTSPSWIILQSLDYANKLIEASEYKRSLSILSSRIVSLKSKLQDYGYKLSGDENLKISIIPQSVGTDGYSLGDYLREQTIEPEFISRDLVVLMLTPSNSDSDIALLEKALLTFVNYKSDIREEALLNPRLTIPKRVLSIRQASLCPYEYIDIDKAEGRVAALGNTSCPPAVPIIMPGELITTKEIEILRYFGYSRIKVVCTK